MYTVTEKKKLNSLYTYSKWKQSQFLLNDVLLLLVRTGAGYIVIIWHLYIHMHACSEGAMVTCIRMCFNIQLSHLLFLAL